jgi:hypothetical protein
MDFQLESTEASPCYWCGKLHKGLSWACAECYPKKEAAYKKAREQKITDYGKIVGMVLDEVNKPADGE